MGYTTDFSGNFKLNKTLSPAMHNFLTKFSETRRMSRKQPKEFGIEGEFFVDGSGGSGQGHDKDIIDYNGPPSTQPGLWCQWIPSSDGNYIQWDENEKFYEYRPWLLYLINKILAPNGYILNGKVTWYGEENGDVGEIIVKNNKVFTHPYKGKKTKMHIEDALRNKYIDGNYKTIKNYMQPDVVFIVKEPVSKPIPKKVKVATPSTRKSITIKIDGLKEGLDDKQINTLMNVIKSYSKGLVEKDAGYEFALE